ncbi:MAG: UDP-N-acetylmuramoyl-L-alanyl-D-glutamate--2,6-diaminopimelate ligase [Simkania negevensis]|nr:UDP-N-acetylmuramoyl-L-alanyl-D-glutamate--2,6-diaminopimelate ligase [Simkania negevensis]
MKLQTLFKDLPVQCTQGAKEVEITGISSHSKFIAPGNLFIAKKGTKYDGSSFVKEAISAGAAAILTEIYNPFFATTPQIIHPQVSSIEGAVASRFYRSPSQELFLVGVTGTNGKTTTSYLIHHLLDDKETPAGLMGTIECIIGESRFPSHLTTPDLLTNQKLLREMVDRSVQTAVMEVTSHALDQNRVEGIDFNVAIFTNLSQDHLDYHETMEKYREAKQKLFTSLDSPEKVAIVNQDDPSFAKLISKTKGKIITYGLNKEAMVRAEEIQSTLQGTSFRFVSPEASFTIETPLLGQFNIYNALAATIVALLRKLPIPKIQKKLKSFAGVPGRLEKVENPKQLHLIVDFAHTEDALKNVLLTLGKIKKGKLITLFGCGGDRDKDKRPKMGRVAEELSDQLIITSDNPRGEEPSQICEEILLGLKGEKPCIVEVDRRKAIEKAISLTGPQDILLIAGRGHEPFQKIGNYLLPFDDREVVRCLASS